MLSWRDIGPDMIYFKRELSALNIYASQQSLYGYKADCYAALSNHCMVIKQNAIHHSAIIVWL